MRVRAARGSCLTWIIRATTGVASSRWRRPFPAWWARIRASLNCTLRLLENKFHTSAIAKDENEYAEKLDETDNRFSTVSVPIRAIAVDSGQDGSGVFELNSRDERYLPLEGAGAVSNWRSELPQEFRQFDYDTISDVVMYLESRWAR